MELSPDELLDHLREKACVDPNRNFWRQLLRIPIFMKRRGAGPKSHARDSMVVMIREGQDWIEISHGTSESVSKD